MKQILGPCLVGLLWPAVVQAQVANGDFAAGPSGWDWKRAEVEWGQLQDGCWAALSPFNTSASRETPSIGTTPAFGRVGALGDDTPAGGSWWVCRQIQQDVTVPTNTELSFDVRFGVPRSNVLAIWVEPVELNIEVVANGVVVAGRYLQGESYSDICQMTNDCPGFARYTMDISPAWGQNVTLRLRTGSGASTGWSGRTSEPTPAWVDNIQFTSAPGPAPPRMNTPSVNGSSYAISWRAVAYTSNYVLEQSVNNAAWTQVYAGPSTGWTTISAPSGDYRYRVKACGNGCSEHSNEVLVSVPQETPGNPTANIVGRSFQLSWGASSGAVRYVLEQKGEDGLWVTAYDGPATLSTLYNIAPGVYGYRVKACGSVVCSGYSAEQYFTAVDLTPVIVDYIL